MVVMGATLGGLSDVSKGSDMVVQATEMNKALRTGMDMMVRDMMQVGSGLPPGHVINVASGAGSSAIKMPGPPGTAYTLAAGYHRHFRGAARPGSRSGDQRRRDRHRDHADGGQQLP